MSIPKEKLYELIANLPEDNLVLVLEFLEKLNESNNSRTNNNEGIFISEEVLKKVIEGVSVPIDKSLNPIKNSIKSKIIEELYSNPLKLNDEVLIPTREERNAR